MLPPWHVSWLSLDPGQMKLNFDSSCIRDRLIAGFEVVIRDHHGEECLSFVGPLPGCSAIEDELQTHGYQDMIHLVV